jgi:hypothetical protein
MVWLLPLLVSLKLSAAINAKSFIDPVTKLNFSFNEKEWTIFDSNDYASAGSVFLAKLADKKLTQATLSLRLDEADFKDAKKYTERWLKDYPKFGFELLLSQEYQYGNLKGYEIELSSTKTDKRLRQFVVKNTENKFLIFTCSAVKNDFPEVLKHCQKLLISVQLPN